MVRPLLRWLVISGGLVSAAAAQPASITVDYPLENSIFPPDLAPPTFLWRDPAPGATSWTLQLSFAGRPPLTLRSAGERLKIGRIDPRAVGAHQQAPHAHPGAGRRAHLETRRRHLGPDHEAVRHCPGRAHHHRLRYGAV